MCGIAGFIDNNRNYNLESVLNNMIESIKHRGPDNLGKWIDQKKNISVGHARLSIRDLSDRSNQPIISDNERFILSYNGEIYNIIEIKKFLESKFSFFFKDNNLSDTIILLKLIELNGLENSLNILNGMFAFFLLDQKKKEIFIVRDKFGQKPLYYKVEQNFFAFASELKAFKKHPFIKFELDPVSVNYFINYSYISAPRTIFKNIHQLEPGSYLRLSYENLKLFSKNKKNEQKSIIHYVKWWSPKKKINKNYESKNTINNYLDVLRSSIKEMLVSDVPTGTFLSGGIDSSLITSICSEVSEKKIDTFTVGFSDFLYDESQKSKLISNHLNTNHHEIFLENKDILEISENLTYIYDEPFADSSQIPSIYLSRFAKSKITVALTGDGGDELFGGYNRYFYLPRLIKIFKVVNPKIIKILIELYLKFPKILKNFVNYFIEKKNITQFEDKLIKLSKVLQSANINESLYLETIKTNNSDFFKNPHNSIPGNSYNYEDANDLMYLDKVNYLPNDILCKVDRATMYSSLESRAPFLSNQIVDYVDGLDTKLLIKNTQGKLINKSALSNYLPMKLFFAPKQGFGVPLNAWLKGPLLPWAKDLFNNHNFSENYNIDNYHVKKIWTNFLQSGKGDEKLVWNLLILKSWDERWNV